MTRFSSFLVLGVFMSAFVALWLRSRQPAPAPAAPPPPEAHITNLLRGALGWGWVGRTDLFTGSLIDTYVDGLLKSRSIVSNGVLQGLSQGWHTNGMLQVEETYRTGVSHGLRSKWHPDGHLLSEAPIEEGRIQGVFQRWEEQGLLIEEIEMGNGQPDGLARSYHLDGSIQTEARMREGQVVKKESWGPGEMIRPTLAPRDGRRAAGQATAILK